MLLTCNFFSLRSIYLTEEKQKEYSLLFCLIFISYFWQIKPNGINSLSDIYFFNVKFRNLTINLFY